MNFKFRFRLGLMVLAVLSAFTFLPNTSASSLKADLIHSVFSYPSMFQANTFKFPDKLMKKPAHNISKEEKEKKQEIEIKNSRDFAPIKEEKIKPEKPVHEDQIKPVIKPLPILEEGNPDKVKPVQDTKPVEFFEEVKPIKPVKPFQESTKPQQIKPPIIFEEPIQTAEPIEINETIKPVLNTKPYQTKPPIKPEDIKPTPTKPPVKPIKFDLKLLTQKFSEIFKEKQKKEDNKPKISRDFPNLIKNVPKAKGNKDNKEVPKYQQFLNNLRDRNFFDFLTRKDPKFESKPIINPVIKHENVVFTPTGDRNNTIDAGARQVTIGQFKLRNNTSDDVLVRKMFFSNIGSGNLDDLVNFSLYMNGMQVSTNVRFNNNSVSIYLSSNAVIPHNETREFFVIADISREARPESTFQFKFGAIELTNINTHEEFNPVDTRGNPIDGDTLMNYIIVEPHSTDINVRRVDGFNDIENAVAGSMDITFMKFAIENSSNNDIMVNSISVKLIGTGAVTNNYQNFTGSLFVNGMQVGSAQTFDPVTGLATFNNLSISVSGVGQEVVDVVVDTIELDQAPYVSNNASAVAGSNVINATTNTNLHAGDQIVISSDGTAAGNNAEIVTVAQDTPAGSTQIPVNETIMNSHYGDIVAFTSNVLPTAKIAITNVEAWSGNIINLVPVYEDHILLGDGHSDTMGDGNCNGGTADNYLCGATFNLIQSGMLNIAETGQFSPRILVAGETNAGVFQVRFSAANDEVQVKDIYLKNSFGNQFDASAYFKLYNESGQLLATEQLINGKLHFDINFNRIIVPNNRTTIATIKADVNSITNSYQTAKRLKLELDTSRGQNGIEAVTSSTGSDLSGSEISGNAIGSEFVVYKTKFTLDRIPTTNTALTSGIHKEIFRFKITPDAAGHVLLGRIPFVTSTSSANINIDNVTVEDAINSNTTYNTDYINYGYNTKQYIVLFNNLLVNSPKEFVVYADININGTINNNDEIFSQLSMNDYSIYSNPFMLPTNFTFSTIPSGIGKDIIWADGSDSTGNEGYLGGYLCHPDSSATSLTFNGTTQTNSQNAQSINLHAGWNLISSYIIPNDNSVESVFSELSRRRILEQVNDQQKVFNPNLPNYLNTLQTFEGGKGYFVKVNRDTILNIYGDNFVTLPYTQNLKEGWNLIGYPRDTTASNILCMLHEIYGNADILEEVKDEYGNRLYRNGNNNGDSTDWTDEIGGFTPGKAYWIKVNQNSSINITDNSLPCI